MGKYAWSKDQKQIFNSVLNGNQNIAIRATAGSGKSTTLVEVSKLLPVNSSSIFIAFNKSIVEELKERLPKKFEVSTLHSMGLDVLYRNFGKNVKLNQSKIYKMAQKMILKKKEITEHRERNSRIFYAQKGYDFLRSTLTNIEDEDAVEKMLERFGITSDYGYDDLKELVGITNKYNQNKKRTDVFEIDFSDMIYLPATLEKLKYPKYDNVLVDESQDLNLAQHMLISKIRSRKGRLINVGDGFQQIYLFAGSDSASFKRFEEADNTISLPLSVTYRCPINVVEEARRFSPEITAAPDAEYGFVGEGFLDNVEEGDCVLCRNNSPLFEAYLQFLYEGKKAYIVGKDIAERFHNLIKPYKNSHITSLIDGLNEQLNSISDALSHRGVRNPEQHPKYQSFLDIARSLSVIAEGCQSIKMLERRIDEVFHPKKDAIVLSSIHKAKGLEYDRVFLLRPDLLPSKFAKTEEEIQQENNLMFVAITRAKKQFFYVHKNDE
jgi:superfamily I DNA/RNA helicase